MGITSKFRTAWRLASKGDLDSFKRQAKNNALSLVSDTRKVTIGDIDFRMYATASDDLFLIDDDREYRMLERVADTRLGCVYDIGAHLGLHTLYYSAIAGRVISFEPAPKNYARLTDNIRLNGRTNISALNIALSDQTGMLDFLENGISQTGTLLTHARHARGFHKIRVQAHRLDELDLPAPDLLKIDCEGAEMQVFRGAAETLRKHRPYIHLEVHPQLGVSEAKVQEFLHAAGYGIDICKKGDEMLYLCRHQTRPELFKEPLEAA
jgi:FkbM family methyltransferase